MQKVATHSSGGPAKTPGVEFLKKALALLPAKHALRLVCADAQQLLRFLKTRLVRRRGGPADAPAEAQSRARHRVAQLPTCTMQGASFP